MEKLEMVGPRLPDGEKTFEDMYKPLGTIPACDGQTDRQTHRQTSCYGIVHAMHMRHEVKIVFCLLHRTATDTYQ